MSDPKIEAVQRLYEAYGRGDVDAVLAELADNVDWSAEAASRRRVYGNSTAGESPGSSRRRSGSDVTEFTPLSFTSNDTT